MVLVGAMLIFGERLNWCQWTGVILAIISLFLLSRSSKKESVDFTHNKWIMFVAIAAIVGAVSGLYDKYIMTELSPMFVQGWYNFYGTEPYVRSGVVQFLSDDYDGHYRRDPLVSSPQDYDTVPLELGYSTDLNIHFSG